MIRFRDGLLALGVAASVLAWAASASATDDYPNRPIKLVIPSAAGGPTDLPARLASQILTARLGQPVVVENRPGAGGAIGARAVATAPPDGYTLLVGNTSTLAVIPAVSTAAGYDPVKDFVPIVRMTEGFQILIVRADAPWKTAKELIDDSKANPTRINYAHTGPGGLPHLAGEVFMLRSGAKLNSVPYRGGGESLNAVLTGAVHATFENIAILRGQITEGKVRALGVQNRTRTPLLPEIPTMTEVGVPDAEANTFFGLVAPAGTPQSVIDRISKAINEGLATPETQRMITNLGSQAQPNTPAEFAAYIAAQHKKWREVGKAANVVLN
jgi:tripartite-type tricarboxylate transporter receptor subunit TctC